MKSKKNVLVAVFFLSIMCTSTNTYAQNQSPSQNTEQLVGGWYPVFFDNYDQSKVDSIKKSISTGGVSRVVISCMDNIQLADKIKAGIQSDLNFAVEQSCQPAPKDTGVTYKTDQVVVTVYTRNQ